MAYNVGRTKVARDVNLNSIKELWKIRYHQVENGLALDCTGVVQEDKGKSRGINWQKKVDADTFVHNHPVFAIGNYENEYEHSSKYLGAADLRGAVSNEYLKVFAGDRNDGFTAMDFSTSKISKENAINAIDQAEMAIDEECSKIFMGESRNSIKEAILKMESIVNKYNIKLAKECGWIYSNLKWSDFKGLL